MLRDESRTVNCSSSVIHLSSLKAAVFFLDYVYRDRSVEGANEGVLCASFPTHVLSVFKFLKLCVNVSLFNLIVQGCRMSNSRSGEDTYQVKVILKLIMKDA